jgi:hypothetical protein
MITVSGKAIGRRRALFDDFSVPPPENVGDGGPLTLRALITHLVVQEVGAFQSRQARRAFDRILSNEQIERDEKRGKISPEGATKSTRRLLWMLRLRSPLLWKALKTDSTWL